ncbi:MAG TPA: TspO/MBR family protein [Saprospiraceae bacterium]|nr:TspO/MBR family protein [Saprospiraceae bacterium]
MELNKQFYLRLLLFFLLNFGALAIGSLFTSDGVSSNWYANLNKAPWTPPGWVFGAAWTTIMICFSFYMAFAIREVGQWKWLIGLFAVQWVLNVSWNPVFFHSHQLLAGLIVISALTILVAYFFFNYWSDLGLKSLLIAPYLIWLIIATSLNAYILVQN